MEHRYHLNKKDLNTLTQKTKISTRLLKNPIHFLGLGGGLGLAPFMPGTFGTLMGIPLYLLIEPLSLPLYTGLVVVLFVIGIPICHRTAQQLGQHDHPAIVWDEVVGFLFTMIAVPFSWFNLLLGFILFRIFDILKPWPIKQVDQKVSGGLGVMLDDILAGIFAAAVLYLIQLI